MNFDYVNNPLQKLHFGLNVDGVKGRFLVRSAQETPDFLSNEANLKALAQDILSNNGAQVTEFFKALDNLLQFEPNGNTRIDAGATGDSQLFGSVKDSIKSFIVKFTQHLDSPEFLLRTRAGLNSEDHKAVLEAATAA